MRAKGQAGVEYASILVLILVALIPIVYMGTQMAENESRTSQAKAAVGALADGADLVFAQGPGAVTVVDITLPAAVNPAKTGFYGKEIRINVFLASGAEQDVFALARGNVSGTMPTTPGFHRLRLEMMGSGVVRVTEPS